MIRRVGRDWLAALPRGPTCFEVVSRLSEDSETLDRESPSSAIGIARDPSMHSGSILPRDNSHFPSAFG